MKGMPACFAEKVMDNGCAASRSTGSPRIVPRTRASDVISVRWSVMDFAFMEWRKGGVRPPAARSAARRRWEGDWRWAPFCSLNPALRRQRHKERADTHKTKLMG